MLENILAIVLLIAGSAFFSISEISLAASRKIKLKVMADEGNVGAARVIALQEQPGNFFTVVQIGLNAVAILGGIIGDTAFSPYFESLLIHWLSPEMAGKIGFLLSFSIVTGGFILFADLMPKRIGMAAPESISTRIVTPMQFCITVFKPLVWFFNGIANTLFKLFNIPTIRKEDITSDDIYTVFEQGALAGVLGKQEHHLIENVFELESRTVPSSMTPREDVIYFDIRESEQSIREKISSHPHSKFLVCDNNIDSVVGYVDSKDMLMRILNGKSIALHEGLPMHNPLFVPDSLTLSETLESFKGSSEDFAVILNEYALVVGIITLNDVMSTLMGDLVNQNQEELIVQRDENTWLIEGSTPIDDVMRALDIDEFPDSDNYETIGGFMMFMLRKIPKRTDYTIFDKYKFEVVDIDNFKIDQLLITRMSLESINKEELELAKRSDGTPTPEETEQKN
ncbi:MAG: hemolysin family protein [Plesiomonas sp.]|uniref:hemolysin family protein n=1 Tax=Plesiomonas sp. TaxID=2486279 RepID=UPI003EE64837